MLHILVIFLCITKVLCLNNCSPCTCLNNGHNFEANCNQIVTKLNITSVPTNLDLRINVLYLNGQPLKKLPNNTFIYLKNVSKLFLAHCQLKTIERNAFKNLTNLRELELSNNKLTDIPIEAFQHILKLEELFLNNNKLKTLKRGLLSNLTRLKTVDFARNELEYIEADFFEDTINLRAIALNENILQFMDAQLVEHLVHLNTFTVFNNPWHCYCNLTSLYTTARKYYDDSSIAKPKCTEPKELRHIEWTRLGSLHFTCQPKVTVIPSGNILFTKQNESITIVCQVQANPIASVKWIKNNRSFNLPNMSIGNDFIESYNITVSTTDNIDKYTCVARNTLGQSVSHITLMNKPEGNTTIMSMSTEHINFGCKLPFFNKQQVVWTYHQSIITNTTLKYNILIGPSKNDETIFQSVLIIKNVSTLDEGIYKCSNTKSIQYFQLIVLRQYDNLALIISLSIVLPVIFLVFLLVIWCLKYRKNSKMQLASSHESISLKFLADGPESQDELMEESPCYMTS